MTERPRCREAHGIVDIVGHVCAEERRDEGAIVEREGVDGERGGAREAVGRMTAEVPALGSRS